MFQDEKHPRWIEAFKAETRAQQLADDDEAWAALAGTLIAIVAGGVILAMITVSMCLTR